MQKFPRYGVKSLTMCSIPATADSAVAPVAFFAEPPAKPFPKPITTPPKPDNPPRKS